MYGIHLNSKLVFSLSFKPQQGILVMGDGFFSKHHIQYCKSTGMSCWYLANGLLSPLYKYFWIRPVRSGEINQLTITIVTITSSRTPACKNSGNSMPAILSEISMFNSGFWLNEILRISGQMGSFANPIMHPGMVHENLHEWLISMVFM